LSDAAGRQRLSGAQIVVEYLIRQGVPVVAGIPGHGSWALTDALLDRQDAIRTVQVMHEQAAVHLADGFCRATGRPIKSVLSYTESLTTHNSRHSAHLTLRSAVDAIRLARRTLGTIKGNLFWAFAYNVAAIPLAAAGLVLVTIGADVTIGAQGLFHAGVRVGDRSAIGDRVIVHARSCKDGLANNAVPALTATRVDAQAATS